MRISLLFLPSLSNVDITTELIIHVNTMYNEVPLRTEGTLLDPMDHNASEKSQGALLNSLQFRFNKLGQALQFQMNLSLLVIHGDPKNGKAYAGLKAVLMCRSLETLRISGIPRFLQDKDIPMGCLKLKELSMQDVLLDTEQAASNFWEVVAVSSKLVRLAVRRSKFTRQILSTETPRLTLEFGRIECLDLSNNELGGGQAIDFVRIALSGNPRLKRLYLSGNRGIGGGACEDMLKLLASKKCWLKEFEVKDTGVDMRTLESVKGYLSHSARCM
jgi:hypothetical protein